MSESHLKEMVTVEEFIKRKSLNSFEELFAMARKAPKSVQKILKDAASDPTCAYPNSYAAMYALGILQGVLYAGAIGNFSEALDGLVKEHEDILQLRPRDYLGEKRTHARAPK